ncbi:nebulin [Ascaphus truei]|uniref:nebulin n=1 Tax=Ascaphus truei TaxID=8439 RepID=UPI003F5A76B9
MADEEEYEEEYEEYYTEETIHEEGGSSEPKSDATKVIEEIGPSGLPTRKRLIRKKVDTSKFMTPYIEHSKKMQDLFSQNKYKELYEKHRGEPYAITIDTPELRRIKKVQNQLSEVKYRMGGQIARTMCHVDGQARDIEHAKKVSLQMSKILYKQNWEDTKEKYLLPPDAPELIQAVKNTAMFSKKLYTADWEEDKTMYFPYSDSPELRRVASAQKAVSDINYKKGNDQQKLQFTSLADRPDIAMAKKVSQQLSDVKYREDYQKKVKGRWSQTPCYEIAVARRNADILSDRKYQEDFENVKDQINFMQTETPEYKTNKKARLNASTIKYKEDYEKTKGPAAYHTLPATENPLLRQLRKAGNALSDKLYHETYEKSKATSINYCDTPKFQLDNVLKNFDGLKYREKYQKNVLGHYIGSYEDPYMLHCSKVSALKSDKNYRADYEEDKSNFYYPQTLTQEYEAGKKLDKFKDYVYKQRPDTIKYTQVTDTPEMVQAIVNAKQLSDLNYKSKHEKEKFKCSIPEDSPFILQSRVNAYNLSDKWYKYDWNRSKAKKFDIKIDAIPLVAAKANRRNASDVSYKKDYEKNRGKMIGALSIHDDPHMLRSAKVAKNQSDRLYRKDYEKTKTKYSMPLDMIPITLAKKAQSIASNLDYKHPIHNYFYPPDCMSVALAKKAYNIQSDVDYKADYNSWVKGCGWAPYGSLGEEKVKKATQILDERKYRQRPDTFHFTSIEDDPTVVQSKINQRQRSDINYKAEGEKVIHKYSLPADIPEFIQARVNAYNLSDNTYKQGLAELKTKGYDLKIDAISIRAAKAARKAASDVQYKKDYEKQKGKLIGFRNLQDDPKLVHYKHLAKLQSDREYKKDYEKTKTKYNTPLDMVNVVSAKKAQDIASNIHYKHRLHNYTYLPDAMSLELSKNMMQIQSDNLYKSDLSWLRGTGWIPFGSLDVEKVKKAGAALDEKKYRQHPDTIKFTSIVDSPVMVQAKTNALQLSDRLYKSSGEKNLPKYHLSPDIPQFIQARCNAANISNNYYTQDWLKTIAKGHHVLGDSIPIKAAKASRNIASDYKYKEAYEKARGHHVGFRSLQDDPKLVHFMAVAKMQSEREYKKDYEKTKTKYHTPLDMVSISAAKKAQEVATNINYKKLIHHYTFLPDTLSVELSRNRMQIQSDNLYKQDYNSWSKGMGWIPLGSLEVEKVKKAGEALSERKYRQHPDTVKFTSVPDSMEMALAQSNTKQLSDLTYKAAGEKMKHKYNLSPDDPNFIQAKVNAINISDSSYKADWLKHLAKGYDLKPDSISVVAAKASRNIASDYKYKQAYEKDKGKHVGFRSLQDDPKLVHYMHVAKIQSDREYTKDYQKSKTKYHTPHDMFSITAAKKAQEVSSNTNYKQLLHSYTLMPDAMDLALSKNRMEIQSDNLYKTDFNNWLKGVGWVPIGSLEVEKAKKAKDILSENKYRQLPDKLKFSIPYDAMDQVLARNNALTMNKRLYTDAWNTDKTKIHVMPDTPEIVLSKVNQLNMSDKSYKLDWEEYKKKGYDLRPDAISIKAAKASSIIASDYKYKKAYEATRGKHIGFRSLQDDPKLVHFMQVAKMQSEREYKKDYEKSKTKFHTPVDMFSVTAAKLSQNVATNLNYKRLIHHYSLLPDAMNLELSKNRMQIQSDNLYKADYNEYMKGVGWSPFGSQESEKSRKAMELISEKKYRQKPDTLKFSSLMDSMEMVLAKNNAVTMDRNLYKGAWEKDKTKIHVMPDTPEVLLAKANAINISEKKYKQSLEESKKRGYDLRVDAISIKAAKASRDIASDYKYKKNYETDKGKLVGFRSLQDDPKLVHFMQVAKMQSDREYKKDYEKTKTKYHTPVSMVSVMAAKEAQAAASNINYKRLIHKYVLMPDAMEIQLAKNMNQIQSDHEYKIDYKTWYKGMGWSPLGSLDVEKTKKATQILSDAKYREHPSKFAFSKLTDSMDMELAKQNAQVMNKRLYTDAWEKDKIKIHVMPDTPDILQAKQNKITFSEKQYKLGWEETIRKGYDLRPDAISIKAAKASRDIASDYKYKAAFRKQQGHHVGFRSLQDDPKSVWAMHVAKIQSDREYRKDYEKSRTKFNTPVDMLGILLAKKCQTLVSDIDYKRRLHNWTCLPDQTAFVQARKVYEIQSDNVYKADYNEFMKGVGWSPYGSQESEKSRKAMELISEKKYRQKPDTLKFSSLMDSMEMVLAKNNAVTMDRKLYSKAWEKDKRQIHIMPDTPEILLAKMNLLNTSDKLYKAGYEELKKHGYDLRSDAISIKAAKASREIASDYKYKAAYRKQQGHHVGFRSLQDDPKSVWAMHVAKIQSDREYKKDFDKSRTKFNMPADMLGILLAKQCQTLVSDIDYKRRLHKWTCLPDQSDVVHARKTYDIQSDILYKADLQWLKGTGWSPSGSLDDEKNKRASLILNEKKYRQHPDKLKFTSVTDSMEMVLAKTNAETINKRLYTDAWNKDKTKLHIMPDTPEVLLAKQNKINLSEKLYKKAMEDDKVKGYDLRSDAIAIKAARASRDIASDYKYKAAYRKQLGHHVGFRSMQDDPKLVWCMHVAKIQSDRVYKKDFDKWRTKFNSPVDMLGILLAKKCQILVSDIDYRRRLHNWTCLPDQNDVTHARKAYDLQSDNLYKSDLQWLRGTGWVPIGSLDVEKTKRAGDILSEKKYRQAPDTLKFTSVTDSMEMVLAKANAETMDKRLYTDAWNKDKTKLHIMPDTPEIVLARQNKINCSDTLYKLALEESKKKGYDLRIDAIPIKAAKASRDIASDYKYKTGYRKQLGHHVGYRSLKDDPKSVWAMHIGKMQSAREYHKDFEKWKTKFNMPVDMLDIQLAKKCQTLVSDVHYRRRLHQWTCLPDQGDVIHARKAYDLQSDNLYKADLQWLKGTGWVPIGSLEVEKNRRAGDILSEKKYRQRPDTNKFTSVTDSMEQTLAKANAELMNKRLYTEAWNKDKTTIHVLPDSLEIMLAKANRINYSEKLYKLALEEDKKKGYDLRLDAIAIRAAKASRDIVSDYKYKTGYRKQLGHHVGFRSLLDDPKSVWAMHVAKIQSDRVYKKDFEKSKTKYNSPVEMLSVLLAKNCQKLVSDIDYRQHLHKWTCLPDQNDVIQARKAYDLQSDALYKSDLDWMKGVGWVPVGSLAVLKAKRAGEILSDKCYRQKPDTFKFTPVLDSFEIVLAKSNALQMNNRLYTEAWDKDKTTIHVMPDTPEIMLAKSNSVNISNKLYTQGWQDTKMKGYDLKADAIAIKSARASRDIASDYKYKTGYRKQLGHHVGFRSLLDDPKSVWAMHVAKIQSDRVYKKDFEKSKTKYNSPVEMLSVLLAKNCQKLVSDIDYRRRLHKWTCLPDQNDVIQAKKAYNLQSDWLYKSDMEWIRGCGWIPHGSLDVNKVKKAQEILSDRKYRQHPDSLKFTSVVDSPAVVLAKANALQISESLYRDAWDKEKTTFHLPSDTPMMVQSKLNAVNISNKQYQQSWDDAKMKGYDMKADAISIVRARASRDIASDYKYKTGYRKQLGHHVGFRSLLDDPKSVWAMHVAKIQSDRVYKKDFEKSKTKYNSPVEMLSVLLAKNCQKLVSDIDYRQHLHKWTCLPDQNDVIQAKKAYNLQSDWLYKSDMEWIRGCGWMPSGSLEVNKVKKAQEILSDNLYRQAPNTLKFTSIVDSPEIVLSKTNALQISNRLYRDAWDQEKTKFHLPSDTPQMVQSKVNAVNISNKLYTDSWDKVKMNYDLRADAIPIKVAKASREIASDYKYKLNHEKQKGHYIGTTTAQGDNKMAWCLRASKLPSYLEYTKDFDKLKTKVKVPADMVSILSAKECQTMVSEIDYRQHLHKWTCHPEQNDIIQARKAYDLQSDALYKADLEWLRGVGWMPHESHDVKRVKFAQDILSERKYRTKPETLSFTPITDRVDYVSAKEGAEILSDIKYHEAWNNIKTKYTVINDSPLLITAREAAKNINQKLYKENWDKVKATSYLLPPDAVQISHAKKSNAIQSELKYKANYIKQKGHYLGVPTLNDDPKLRWFKHANLIQNDREYKKVYEKSKSKINIPGDMVSIEAAKQGQAVASEIDYRHYLHQWTCHPDQNDCIQARKAYDLQSDNIYKSDLEWIRGCGWIPFESVEHQKVKRAQELINERAYKKDAIHNYPNYTHVVDPPAVVLAKLNAINQSDLRYKETFTSERGHYIGSADTPQLSHSREMSKLVSDKLYKDSWDGAKALGYQLPPDYIPLVRAKHAELVKSDLKYKEGYEKDKGHYLAGAEIGDFPSVVKSLAFQKMRSMLCYKKAYEDNKAKINIPGDMLNNVLAKKCQQILSEIEYRHYLHDWTLLPDERNVAHARKANEILSDVLYKDDLTWLKGIGCYVWDTPQILLAKNSYDLQSQLKYSAASKDNFKNYSVVTDTPVYVTAIQSAIQASDLKYKEDYNKSKEKYTTVLETVDYDRTQSLKNLFSNNVYKDAWDKVKATGYKLPPDTVGLALAKKNKHIGSKLKYHEEYEKFKALYTLPRNIHDDPNIVRCLKVGKLPLDRLYRDVYEKNKMKIHIAPDMLEIISARDTQNKVSEVDYRKRLHEWTCLPDLQVFMNARKVNDQLSDIVYKDDLNWLKGLGCFVWDTPEILHAKHAYDLRSDYKYKCKAEEMKKTYTSVMDTPVYVQAVASNKQSSDVVYHSDYEKNVRGKVVSTTTSVDLDRANNANKIQSVNLYREAGVKFLPKGYSIPADTPYIQQAKHAQVIKSDLKYKEAYEHLKAKSYKLGPDNVSFVNIRNVNRSLNERLYRQLYHKQKDKIHTTPDTPEIRQVKATQEAISDLIYKSDFFKMQGHKISLPYTPEIIHCRYVGEITSDNKYKEDLQWMKGLGCFLYHTPDMVRSRDLRKLWSNYLYTNPAKKMLDKYTSVMDTPEYRTVQELKTHLSNVVYRAAGNKQKTTYTSILDTPDLLRAKKGQEIQSQYLYGEVASKQKSQHHADGNTPILKLAKHVKDIVSEKKYKSQYEKLKHKHTSLADTPILIRAKKAYFNASDLRYKETFEKAKGKYHTVKDALDIVYHRKVTDDISKVKYKEKYVNQLGIWRSIPDRPDYDHHRAVTDLVSDYKYKEDLTWLKGIGCYAFDTPDLALAGQNKKLYSMNKYRESFEKTKSKFQYSAETPLFNHFKYATQLANEKLYKADYENWKTKYTVIPDEPRTLLAKTASEQISQWKYKENYEKLKDKYTSIVDTPEHMRTQKVGKQISDIIYKMDYNKGKAKGYTSIHDTPMLLHVRKVKDKISELKYRELYEKSKGHCNLVPDAVEITTAKAAYKSISNLDYKKKYEATKAHWQWTVDRPDFLQNAKTSLQQSDYEYKLDREFLRGCKLSIIDDKDMVLALNNAKMNSNVKYKKKYEKGTYLGDFKAVSDTPQILHDKSISNLISTNKYKEDGKKQLPFGTFTTLAETRDTAHVKEVTKIVSEKHYKRQFQKEKGKSNYAIMLEPPEVKHAMEVAKAQSNVSYRKDAKANLNYTSIVDRPDIKKATQVNKLVSDIHYKAKARKEGGRGISILGRPDIELAQEVSKLTSQVKYKENFSKDKSKRPQYDMKESKIYQTLKDATNLASEVKYKTDLKKLHKPVTDMAESLNMHHITSTSKLSSDYQYKKKFQKSKGHCLVVPDSLEQLHVKEATELQSQVKYKEKYEKERGKAMLDFETPTYVTAMESQHMQSEKEYKKDFEESIKGRNLTGLEVTPAMLHVRYATKIGSEKEYRRDLEETIRGKGLTVLEETPELLRAKNATQILSEKEYKKTLESEIKGRGMSTMGLETPDFMRAKNATDIASQVKYKHSAEMDMANYTSVVDTPEIIHAQQVRNLSSQKKYKEEAERTMSYYVPVLDTPEMLRVRENQKNFSTLQYQGEHNISKGKVTVVKDTPEILRVKENQKNFSSILYKEEVGTGTAIGQTPEMERIKRTQDAISTIKYKDSIGTGTAISDLPEVKRVKETQKNISSVMYKESLGQGTPTPVTPEIERVKRNQENFSMVLYKGHLGIGTSVPVTPEMERVKRNQENISSVLYKEHFGVGISTPVTPEMERVKRNQENISSVMYKDNVGRATPTAVTPELERAKRNQENISSVLYKENLGTGTPTPVTPEMERVKRNQENISMVSYKETMGKATSAPVTPEMERVKRNQENISSVLYSDSFRKQIQGKAAFVLDTPEMRRVRDSQRHISSVKYHEDFEKHKGSFTPVVTDPITERVKKNMIDFSDITYRGIQRKVVEIERKRTEQDQDVTDLRVWRTNPGSVFDYDPAEDNIQSRSLHMRSVQARRSREQSRSASALSLSAGDEKSDPSEVADQHHSYYTNGTTFATTTTTVTGYKQAKTTELPQQRSSSVATQQTTASSVPSHPSTTGKTFRAMYDYRAADDDEVSFRDGDAIVNVQTIDEGWMYGTVQRTSKTGMLPANYVETI